LGVRSNPKQPKSTPKSPLSRAAREIFIAGVKDGIN
jgi:hypothetical protein